MDDEALARCLQQEEFSVPAAGNHPECIGLPVEHAATDVSTLRAAGDMGRELSDAELAMILQEQEIEADDNHAPRSFTSPRPSPAPTGLSSLTSVLWSGAFLGCCGGLQLASCMGCGPIATWLCALGGGITGHMTNNNASRFVRGSRVVEDEDDDFYPDVSDDEPPRGLDPSVIEGHTLGHVYTAPASQRSSPRRPQQGSRGDVSSEEDRQCMVCMEAFVTGDQLRTLPCMHRYHQQCIDEWLGRSPECPICKRDITAVTLPTVSPVPPQPKRFPRMRRLWHRSG
uniref:RING-type domain-containing protein n=1 Tax=Pyrodinium bahamense TaxID=73915 RepID=A0A7S0FK54_9DINO